MTRTLKRINHNVKHISTSLLYEIRENQYRSRCANYDYCPHAVDSELSSRIVADQSPEEMIINDLKRTIADNTGLDQRSTLGKLWLEDLIDDAINRGIL
jgi:hypothetical protein